MYTGTFPSHIFFCRIANVILLNHDSLNVVITITCTQNVGISFWIKFTINCELWIILYHLFFLQNGLSDLGITSAEQASRYMSQSSQVPHSQTMPNLGSNNMAARNNLSSTMPNMTGSNPLLSTTQQLEPKHLPIELSATLEQIVGQLDILTQVSYMVRLLITIKLCFIKVYQDWFKVYFVTPQLISVFLRYEKALISCGVERYKDLLCDLTFRLYLNWTIFYQFVSRIGTKIYISDCFYFGTTLNNDRKQITRMLG